MLYRVLSGLLRRTATRSTPARTSAPDRGTRARSFEAHAKALEIWNGINRINLDENILPTRQRARCILRKDAEHAVEAVLLRRL